MSWEKEVEEIRRRAELAKAMAAAETSNGSVMAASHFSRAHRAAARHGHVSRIRRDGGGAEIRRRTARVDSPGELCWRHRAYKRAAH